MHVDGENSIRFNQFYRRKMQGEYRTYGRDVMFRIKLTWGVRCIERMLRENLLHKFWGLIAAIDLIGRDHTVPTDSWSVWSSPGWSSHRAAVVLRLLDDAIEC